MQMIIAVGPSGCGKSHFFINYLKPQGFIEASADHFFEKSGAYQFNPRELDKAHEFSQEEAREAISKGLKVYISNTNTREWERKPYVDLANKVGYEVWLKVFDVDAETCAARNTHGVPLEAVKKMKERIDVPAGFFKV